MKKYFVVSDVHSFFSELMEALNEKGFEKDNPDHILCVCGDLFDRGNQAVKLFEFVKELQKQNRLIYITGNHEDLLFRCVDELASGHYPGYYHFQNGTVKTICQFCGISETQIYERDEIAINKIYGIMQPILDFIRDNSVDYAKIGDVILVHGWIPLETDDENPYHARKTFKKVYDHWEDTDGLDDIERYRRKSYWSDARWINGMEAFKQGMTVPGKTIVCGHFHANWGHSRLHNKCTEWGNDAIFEPFVDEGIIAIDGCVAYSGKINCIILEVDDE
jgi:hypothetical protein